MTTDPSSEIQKRLNTHAQTGQHIGVVAGVISPNVQDSPKLMYGLADELWNTQHEKIELTNATPFKLGSVTKIFSSVVQFLNHGNYDGRLKDFFTIKEPKLQKDVRDIPILDLANYSPGFPSDNVGKSWVPSKALQNLTNLLNFLAEPESVPHNKPGHCYSYSNFGWAARQLDHRSRTPIIMLSATPEEAAARKAGVDVFLPKPLGVSSLGETIKRLLSEGEQQGEAT